MGIKVNGVQVAGIGAPGKDGKSAYEYAKEGGYAGTEEEFAVLMAGPIPVKHGGTGASTAEEARANLGIAGVEDIGNLHVWERVQDGVIEYLTSTDRNDYTDGVEYADSLGAQKTNGWLCSFSGWTSANTWKLRTSDSVVGGVLAEPVTERSLTFNSNSEYAALASYMRGKYCELTYTGTQTGAARTGVFFVPEAATVSDANGNGSGMPYSYGCMVSVYQEIVTDVTFSITYMGQLGASTTGAKIEVGSYVGTGTYGSSNKNSIPINKTTQLVIVQAADHTKLGGYGYYWMLCIRGNTTSSNSSPNTSNLAKYVNTLEWDEETLSWYNDNYEGDQLNMSGTMYKYISIG